MSRVVFLDFDGVLNNADWFKQLNESGQEFRSYSERSYKELDPSRVKLVSDLAIQTNSIIVVSSSWRILNELHELQDYLIHNGLDPSVAPTSATPVTPKGFRGEEVRMWLDANPQYRTYVILDDDGDFYSDQPLVQTSWDEGLLPAHVDIARQILLNT